MVKIKKLKQGWTHPMETILLTLQSREMPQEIRFLREMISQVHETPPPPIASQTADALLDQLSGCLRRRRVFIVAAEPAQFLALKAKLLKALGYAAHLRTHILQLQSEPSREDAAFPVGSAVFLSGNAQLNGFALRCGKQDMIVLPLSLPLLQQQSGQIAEHFARRAQEPGSSRLNSTIETMLRRLGHGGQHDVPIGPEAIVPLYQANPQPAGIQTAAETTAERPANQGKLRAVVAASLAAITIAGSLLFTIGSSADAANNSLPATEYRQVAHSMAAQEPAPAANIVEQLQSVARVDSPSPVSTYQLDLSLANLPGMLSLFSDSLDLFFRLLNWVLEAVIIVLEQIPSSTLPAVSITRPVTTTRAPIFTTRPPASRPATQGVYHFAVAGFGHGVGMSQEGAKEFARQGWTYEQIIKHYYNDSGISIARDARPPSHVTHDGIRYELREYLARVAYREIGRSGAVPDEALKAQMVTAYTIAKRNNFRTTANNQHILSAADWNSNFARQFHAPMLALAQNVLGNYVAFNGAVADTLYFASCAGFTGSAQFAWGDGSRAPQPYLIGGRASPETIERTYPTLTTDQIRALVTEYNANPRNANKITLGSDASQWLRIISTDQHGYVMEIMVGDRSFTGGSARLNFFGTRTLRSHNFTMSFVAG